LDLHAVSEIFKDTKNLQVFEKELNDPDYGINNIDLDGNGQVDYIRVVEEVVGDTHIIILQAAMAKDEFQDVATIEIEKNGSDYNMHVHGNEVIYGANYYIAPSHVRVHTWPIVAWIYRPVYRPYRSGFYWGFYPKWWRVSHPIHYNVYRTRTLGFTKRNTFVVTRSARVRMVTRVKYQPRTSVRVTRHIGYKKTRTNGGKTTVKRGAVKTTNKNGKTTTVKKDKKTTKTKNGKKVTAKKGRKKTAKRKK